MKGLLIFGVIILGSVGFLFYSDPEKSQIEEIAKVNKSDYQASPFKIFGQKQGKTADVKRDIKNIREVNSGENRPVTYLNFNDLDSLSEKVRGKSAEDRRLEAIYGHERDPSSTERVFDPKFVPPEENPYPKTPCTGL